MQAPHFACATLCALLALPAAARPASAEGLALANPDLERASTATTDSAGYAALYAGFEVVEGKSLRQLLQATFKGETVHRWALRPYTQPGAVLGAILADPKGRLEVRLRAAELLAYCGGDSALGLRERVLAQPDLVSALGEDMHGLSEEALSYRYHLLLHVAPPSAARALRTLKRPDFSERERVSLLGLIDEQGLSAALQLLQGRSPGSIAGCFRYLRPPVQPKRVFAALVQRMGQRNASSVVYGLCGFTPAELRKPLIPLLLDRDRQKANAAHYVLAQARGTLSRGFQEDFVAAMERAPVVELITGRLLHHTSPLGERLDTDLRQRLAASYSKQKRSSVALAERIALLDRALGRRYYGTLLASLEGKQREPFAASYALLYGGEEELPERKTARALVPWVLRAVGKDRAHLIPAWIELLHRSPRSLERQLAARALGLFANPDVRGDLELASGKDAAPEVRSAVAAALDALDRRHPSAPE